MPSTQDPGAPEPEDEALEWLSSRKVAKLWPVREAWLPDAACRADVRVRSTSGRNMGTWGSGPTSYSFHPGDVARATPEFAEGRIDIPAGWRTDTAIGRFRDFWFKVLVYGAATAAVALVVAAILGGLAFIVFALTVD
ncbi:hypothetical protein AB0O42_09415 [Streptomyces sp. NPDC089922]|uniref:hypothetical protein n=1 Tax=unclassified Streptomyces TaxID=2593676 RepID=UPI0034492C3B